MNNLKKLYNNFKKKYTFFLNKELQKYGEFNTYDLLKNIAFFLMVIDHIGYYIFLHNQYLRLIGRGSMLIFAVLYGISFKNGSKPHKKILIFAIITTCFQLYFINEIFPLNPLYNFYFSAFLINDFEKIYKNNVTLFIVLIILILPLSFITNFIVEYGFSFLGLMFCGKIFKKSEKNKKDIIVTIIAFLLFLYYQILNFRFNLIYSIILIISFSIIYKILFNFKLKKINNFMFKNLFLIISRRSLELYTIHLTILIILSRWLYINGYIR